MEAEEDIGGAYEVQSGGEKLRAGGIGGDHLIRFTAEEIKKMAWTGLKPEKAEPEELLFWAAARGCYDRKDREGMRVLEEAYEMLLTEKRERAMTLQESGDRFKRTEGIRTVIRLKERSDRNAAGGGLNRSPLSPASRVPSPERGRLEGEGLEWRRLALALADAVDGLPSTCQLSPQVEDMIEEERKRSRQ